MPSTQETAEILHSNRHHLLSIGNYSEADTVLYLIDPVMNHLGYPSIYQVRENQQNKNRPDISFLGRACRLAPNESGQRDFGSEANGV